MVGGREIHNYFYTKFLKETKTKTLKEMYQNSMKIFLWITFFYMFLYFPVTSDSKTSWFILLLTSIIKYDLYNKPLWKSKLSSHRLKISHKFIS